MTKFTIALREIGTYKEVLRSQVMIYDRFFTLVLLLDDSLLNEKFTLSDLFPSLLLRSSICLMTDYYNLLISIYMRSRYNFFSTFF